MDLDIRHAGPACASTGGCSSRTTAGCRSMACTTATSSRRASSYSAYCKLVCVGQEREGHHANTTQGAVGRTFSGLGAAHARLCDGWDTRTPLPGGVTLVWDNHCRPFDEPIGRSFVPDRARRVVRSHLWCAPAGEVHQAQSHAPVGGRARLYPAPRLLLAASEVERPS